MLNRYREIYSLIESIFREALPFVGMRDVELFNYHYGIKGDKPHSPEECAKQFCMSPQEVIGRIWEIEGVLDAISKRLYWFYKQKEHKGEINSLL